MRVGVKSEAVVLPEHGAVRGLAEDVVARVAGDEFALDFEGEVVVLVFGLPIAVNEMEVDDEGAVDDEAFAVAVVDGVLGYEGPAGLAGAVFEERLEDSADSGFVRHGE